MVLKEREFHITPKTPNIWLATQRNWYAAGVRERITEDIVTNGMELEGEIDWGVVLNHMTCVSQEKRYIGRAALENSIAATIGSVASNMGWDMHSPPVVYMSGFHPFWALGKDIELLNARLQLGKDGKRLFKNDAAREAVLTREAEDVERIGGFREKLGNALEAYAGLTLPEDPLYVRILQRLIYWKFKGTALRYRTLELLRLGNHQDVAAILHISPEDD